MSGLVACSSNPPPVLRDTLTTRSGWPASWRETSISCCDGGPPQKQPSVADLLIDCNGWPPIDTYNTKGREPIPLAHVRAVAMTCHMWDGRLEREEIRMIRRTRLSIVFIAAVLMTTVLQPAGAAESESGTPVPEARSTQSQEVAGRVDVVIGDRYVDLTDRVGNRIRMNVPATKLPGQEEPTPVTRFDSGTFGLAISPIADGASALIEISGPDAPTEYVFDFEMPTDWSLVERSDGSVTITDSEGDIVGSIAPPWAVDANADELATSFKVQGANTLVQTVNHEGASYPVLADPSITFGSNIYLWVRGYEIYWWGSVSAAYLAGWICAISEVGRWRIAVSVGSIPALGRSSQPENTLGQQRERQCRFCALAASGICRAAAYSECGIGLR